MKVLVAGLKTYPNQITRALDRYEDVEHVHIWEPNKGHLPSDVDAVIVVIAQLGHGGYWRAKEHYKNLEIPLFVIREGFTECIEDFETTMVSKGFTIVRKGTSTPAPDTALANAFKAANGNETETHETRRVVRDDQTKKEIPRGLSEFEHQTSQEAIAFIRECKANGMKAREIADAMNERGMKKARSNTPWKEANIYQVLMSADGRRKSQAYVPRAQRSVSASSENQGGIKLSANRQNEMIAKVMAAKNLAFERKHELIEEILAGVRTTEHQVIAEPQGDKLQVTMQSIFHEGDQPLMLLDKITAIGILKVLKEIREFVNE